MEAATTDHFILPADWLEEHFYVPEPYDNVTGEILPPGPIQLAPHQKRIINEAFARKEDGTYKYTTIIYSAPKKSGKSAIAAGISLYMADQTPYAQIYCLANDGKQSTDRIYGPIRDCISLHQRLGGKFKGISPNKTEVTLPNAAKIEAVPCDAAGEAGAMPTLSVWSELWGFETEIKRRLWTEMTIPPMKYGRALRWVESYAGFTGQSKLLEGLYRSAVKDGTAHPDFTDLVGIEGEPVVYVNEISQTFAYW